MNMISEIRRRVQRDGTANISIDEFNQLQSEWITRASIESDRAPSPVYVVNDGGDDDANGGKREGAE